MRRRKDTKHQRLFKKENMRRWKPYLIHRVIQCRNCKKESAELYQLLPGGLIHTRCSTCGEDNRFNMTEFSSLQPYLCPDCNNEMRPEQLGGNACYICKGCNLYIRFADLLPDCYGLNGKYDIWISLLSKLC